MPEIPIQMFILLEDNKINILLTKIVKSKIQIKYINVIYHYI